MINEEACLMPNLKECKHFMPWFDALFVRNQELWFGRYNPSVKVVDPDSITLLTYDVRTSVAMLKEDALCFFDKDHHIWVMILSKYHRISWQVNNEGDEIYLRMLTSIAENELKGSKGDYNDLAITNRIKNRYSTWFEERNMKNRYIEKALRRQAINSVYGLQASATFDEFPLKPTPPNHTIYQLPQPKLVQFNDDYTTVVWRDGTHTTVKRTRGDAYDEEKAIMFAAIKRMRGNNGCSMDRYFKKFFDNSVDISNKKKKEKKNGSNKKDNSENNN